MIDYSELVQEVATEIRGGAVPADAIAEIAADCGAQADVLTARFERAYPAGVPAEVDMRQKVEAEIEQACKRYGVPRARTIGPIYSLTGRSVVAICRVGSRVIGVDVRTAQVRSFTANCFTESAMRFADAHA